MDTTATGTPPPIPAPNPEPVLVLTREAQVYLREAAKWAKFLSVVGFIFCLLILVMALFVGTTATIMGHMMSNTGGPPMSIAGGAFSVIYILVDILYFFFPLYLYRFSSRVKKGIVFQDAAHLTRASESLKSFFKLWGIVTAIVICIYSIVLVFAIAFGIGTHMIHA